MKQCQRLWRALESAPALSGVLATWKEIAGEDLPVLKPFLLPGQDLATTYPCPEPGDDGCPRGVVVHGPDNIVAVCRRRPRSCERLTLTQGDIVVYTLDLPKLAARVGSLLGLKDDGRPGPRNGLSRTLYLGAFCPVAGLNFPAYLTLQHDREVFAQVVERLAARDARPFILLAPTTDLLTPACVEMLRTRGAVALGLADFIASNKVGGLVARKPADVLRGFRDGVMREAEKETKRGMVFFPTPPEAVWSDVGIRFRDGHTVSIKVLGEGGVFHYTQMGMVNKKDAKPTKQWQLLIDLAEEHGTLTWQSRRASREQQKRKELLVKDLKRFFRIEGEPIVPTDDRKNWRTVFSVEKS